MPRTANTWANWDDSLTDEQNIAAGALLDAAKMTNIENDLTTAYDTSDTAIQTITIGTVDTLPVGENATASIGGTATAPTLNLGLPTGATGAQGIQGAAGTDGVSPTITVGDTTVAESAEAAAVTNSGTASAVVLDFALPPGTQGPAGAKGDQGDPGTPGTAGTDAPTIASIAFTLTTTSGEVTGGSVVITMSDDSTVPGTVTVTTE